VLRGVGQELDIVDESHHRCLHRGVKVVAVPGDDGGALLPRNDLCQPRHGGGRITGVAERRDAVAVVLRLAVDAVGCVGAGRQPARAGAELGRRRSGEQVTEPRGHGGSRRHQQQQDNEAKDAHR